MVWAMSRATRSPVLVLLAIGAAAACSEAPVSRGEDASSSGADGAAPTDAGFFADAAAEDAGADAGLGGEADAGLAALCPPGGPFGTAVGAIAPDLELSDCDGNRYSVHALCEKKAAWLFAFAGW